MKRKKLLFCEQSMQWIPLVSMFSKLNRQLESEGVSFGMRYEVIWFDQLARGRYIRASSVLFCLFYAVCVH